MLNAFGRNYEEFGTSDNGMMLKNSGKIKYQWGNSYRDLIDNDGNISGLKELEEKISALEKRVRTLEGTSEE